MNNSKHNDSASSHPPTTTSPMNNNNDLFTSTEKNQLDSFLDTFNTNSQTHANNMQTQYNSDRGNGHYATDMAAPSSPTPVLLSPPFSRNNTFGQQHIQTLPIHDGQQQSMYRKASTDNNNKREMDDTDVSPMDMKKYRFLMNDSTANLTPHISPAFTNNNSDTDRQFTMKGTSSAAAPATAATSSAPTKSKGSGRGRKPVHELLSEDQKKANHIASEQKRRANIRIGFDQLVGIVPDLSDCQRSESLILHKSADYIRQLVDTKNSLRDRVRELQLALGEVPDEDSSEGEMDFGF